MVSEWLSGELPEIEEIQERLKAIFPREIGRKIGQAEEIRHASDYDDFYIASAADATEQYAAAEFIITEVKQYLDGQNVQY